MLIHAVMPFSLTLKAGDIILNTSDFLKRRRKITNRKEFIYKVCIMVNDYLEKSPNLVLHDLPYKKIVESLPQLTNSGKNFEDLIEQIKWYFDNCVNTNSPFFAN